MPKNQDIKCPTAKRKNPSKIGYSRKIEKLT
jgi:hypothetical protein